MDKFYKPKSLIKNLVLIDGLGRSGKTSLVQILPSLKSTEHVDYLYGLEQILAGISLGHITQNFGNAYLALMLNEKAYDKLISRSVNFRKTDLSGVYNSYKFKEYKRRLSVKEGDLITKKLKNFHDIFLFCTHNTMASYDIFKKMNINHKIIQLYRNPIDNIFSWYTRGWGKRFGKDPRAFTISIQNNNSDVGPWHLFENKEEWFKSNELEKCLIGAVTLINNSIKKQKKIKSKNIFTLKFENLAESTDYTIKGISKFLKTSTTSFTEKKMRDAKMPRKINLISRYKKKEIIKKHVSKKLFTKLLELEESYKNNYGLNFFS